MNFHENNCWFSKLQAGRQKDKSHQLHQKESWWYGATVDGRNPAAVDRQFIPLFPGFYTSPVVVWDFWTIVTVGAPFFLPGPMVLRDLDLSIHGGETILLLGDHGSGKSSLILAFLGVSRWFDGVGDLRSLKRLKSFACLRDGHSAFFLQQIRSIKIPSNQMDSSRRDRSAQQKGLCIF